MHAMSCRNGYPDVAADVAPALTVLHFDVPSIQSVETAPPPHAAVGPMLDDGMPTVHSPEPPLCVCVGAVTEAMGGTPFVVPT